MAFSFQGLHHDFLNLKSPSEFNAAVFAEADSEVTVGTLWPGRAPVLLIYF